MVWFGLLRVLPRGIGTGDAHVTEGFGVDGTGQSSRRPRPCNTVVKGCLFGRKLGRGGGSDLFVFPFFCVQSREEQHPAEHRAKQPEGCGLEIRASEPVSQSTRRLPKCLGTLQLAVPLQWPNNCVMLWSSGWLPAGDAALD